MRGKPWIPIGLGREVGLSPGPLRQHPETRRPNRVATSAGAGRGLHSNGLRFLNLAGPAGPGAGEGRWALAELREAGANHGPLGPGVRGPAGCAPGPRRRPDGAIRYLPQQPLSALSLPKPTVGSQAFGASSERPSLDLLEGQPSAVGARPALCPAGPLGSGWGRGPVSARRPERWETPGRALGPGAGLLCLCVA